MIKQLYTIDEIRKKISSNEYNAEMLLQHAMVNIAALEQRLAAAEALNVRLAKFFLTAIQCSFDGCDYDGGSMQDDALALGLIVETEPPEGEEGPWYTVPREIDKFEAVRQEVKGE